MKRLFLCLSLSLALNVQAEQQVFEFHQRVSGLFFDQKAIVDEEVSPSLPAFSWVLKNDSYTALVGSLFSLSLTELIQVTDGEKDASSDFSWSVNDRPLWMGFDSSTDTLFGSPGPGDFGYGSFQVVATSGDDEKSKIYTISVDDVILQVTKISSGSQHTCAITTSGAAKCWGANGSGQLGVNDTVSRNRPAQVIGLTSGVTDISAGHGRSCAVLSNGTARCWGYNAFGSLGDGTTTNKSAPVTVRNISNVRNIDASGFTHSCARTSDNNVWCWGANSSRQLGDGTITNRSSPVRVAGISGAIQIALGNYFTCARLSSGIRCWGAGGSGQLGNGSTLNSGTPVNVSNISSASWLSAGGNTACAVVSGSARCWGSSSHGQIGDGTTSSRTTPRQMSNATSGISRVEVGNSHTCVLTSSGSLRCTGLNSTGQLGLGTTSDRTTLATVISSGVSMVSLGAAHTCARLTSGEARCWGQGSFGRIGNAKITNETLPTKVYRGF